MVLEKLESFEIYNSSHIAKILIKTVLLILLLLLLFN